MGRNAKFYKSHKDKKKSSSVLGLSKKESNGKMRTARGIGTDRDKQRSRDATEEEVDEDRDEQSAIARAEQKITKADKLKSKLWQELEAKRANQGKKKYATPKEAGIDYIRQWEKRGR